MSDDVSELREKLLRWKRENEEKRIGKGVDLPIPFEEWSTDFRQSFGRERTLVRMIDKRIAELEPLVSELSEVQDFNRTIRETLGYRPKTAVTFKRVRDYLYTYVRFTLGRVKRGERKGEIERGRSFRREKMVPTDVEHRLRRKTGFKKDQRGIWVDGDLESYKRECVDWGMDWWKTEGFDKHFQSIKLDLLDH
ncbi:MAG: hypothetical protein JJ896_03465 [Rhodothermales bacterium]|nr:hypothetical protein [Rhodothermales bacterium]MBO6778693.1 hypothetical protein [Rhodothermales bacterium]